MHGKLRQERHVYSARALDALSSSVRSGMPAGRPRHLAMPLLTELGPPPVCLAAISMALLTELLLVQRFEDEPFVVHNFEPPEKCQVLLAKALAGVVFCLVSEVVDRSSQRRVGAGERAEALLP